MPGVVGRRRVAHRLDRVLIGPGARRRPGRRGTIGSTRASECAPPARPPGSPRPGPPRNEARHGHADANPLRRLRGAFAPGARAGPAPLDRRTDTRARRCPPRKVRRPTLIQLNPTQVAPETDGQVRQAFDPASLGSLAESLKRSGVRGRIIIRPDAEARRYRIVAGEKRWLLEPIGHVPPAGFDTAYSRGQETPTMVAGLQYPSLRRTRAGSLQPTPRRMYIILQSSGDTMVLDTTLWHLAT